MTTTTPPSPPAMSTWEYCYWLRGFLDGAGAELDAEQVASIKEKLEETIEKDSKTPTPPLLQSSPLPYFDRTAAPPHFKW